MSGGSYEHLCYKGYDDIGRHLDQVRAMARRLDQVVTGAHRDQLSLFTQADDGQYSCGPFVCDGGAGEPPPGTDEWGFIVKGGRVA